MHKYVRCVWWWCCFIHIHRTLARPLSHIQSIWLKRSRTSYPISSCFLSIFPFSLRLFFNSHTHTQHTQQHIRHSSLWHLYSESNHLSLLNKGPGCWISYAAAASLSRSVHLYVLHAIHHTYNAVSPSFLYRTTAVCVCVCRKWNVILIWGNINLGERRFWVCAVNAAVFI